MSEIWNETWISQRAGNSRTTAKSQSDGWEAPLFWVLSVILAGAACYFLLLFSLCQPTLNSNPGVAAYVPPPGTRLIPLPRVSDAPELVELPADPPSPLTALAKAEAGDQQVKRDIRPPIRKRPRVDPREYEQQRFGFQQWNFGNHDWNNNRTWSGGSRSWF